MLDAQEECAPPPRGWAVYASTFLVLTHDHSSPCPALSTSCIVVSKHKKEPASPLFWSPFTLISRTHFSSSSVASLGVGRGLLACLTRVFEGE